MGGRLSYLSALPEGTRQIVKFEELSTGFLKYVEEKLTSNGES
jgi:hypothetical protein